MECQCGNRNSRLWAQAKPSVHTESASNIQVPTYLTKVGVGAGVGAGDWGAGIQQAESRGPLLLQPDRKAGEALSQAA